MTIVLEDGLGARVTYEPGYLQRAEADALLEWMLGSAPWQREAPILFGQEREARRKTCALGEPGLVYRYSGIDRVAVPWPDILAPVIDRLRRDVDPRLNFGLANLYPDGLAGMGKHADDERDIARDSPIAGLSVGAARSFVFHRRGENKARVADVVLEHGSLVVMWGSTQRSFKHALSPDRNSSDPRVNITFRCVVA